MTKISGLGARPLFLQQQSNKPPKSQPGLFIEQQTQLSQNNLTAKSAHLKHRAEQIAQEREKLREEIQSSKNSSKSTGKSSHLNYET